MSSPSLTIFNPLSITEILPEERLELELPDIGYPAPIVVVPWRSLEKVQKLDLLDSLPRELCDTTILKFEWENKSITSKIADLGFKRLFCTSTSRTWPIRNFGYPDFISDKIVSNPRKDIQFSFIGWNNNYVRKVIFERYGHIPSVIKRDEYSYGVEYVRNKDYADQYIDILSRSRFSLCPRGMGTGTKRFWESLRAGAIPILISDQIELPSCWDWQNTILSIKQWQVIENPNKIPVTMILPRGREELLRENCYRAAESFTNPQFIAKYLKDTLTNG